MKRKGASAEVTTAEGNTVSAADLEPFVGEWYTGINGTCAWVPSETDDCTLTLILDERGVGTLRLGEIRFTLPEATDPAAPYPPNVTVVSGRSPNTAVYPGFDYPVRGTSFKDGHLTLTFNNGDAFASYCAIQTPYPEEIEAKHHCVPGGSVYTKDGKCYILDRTLDPNEDPSTVPMHEFGCEQISMCTDDAGCSCTENRCTNTNTDTFYIELYTAKNVPNPGGSLFSNTMPRFPFVLAQQR